ncbi:MAG: hypothetical protein PUC12_07490 [Clostridiales bacterium]|nr:hypothetical protein [Clostridiales bacterium]
MSTGISISSINRIKELAEEKKYSEALEILDTQNLDKSINPQFLRISGEIFRENKRYYDSRKILLRAHQMSPQGLRIIAELIQLYLELGYFSKAQQYYEQYLFYTTPEDTQREYVEYIMKKGTGADIKELASILIPILERLPEERWNFEAVLLYDKMDRKDKALDESRYILENFQNSIYVQPAIDYIEDNLDVDAWFYVYPKEEKEEDTALFGDLIEEEEKLLEADYLRMYPPEAKIMVEAEDKEGIDLIPVKEKKPRKKKNNVPENQDAVEDDEKSVDKKKTRKKKKQPKEETTEQNVDDQDKEVDENIKNDDEQSTHVPNENSHFNADDERAEQISEEKLKKEREAALEKLLSKKINTEQIKESAVKAAKAVKEIDTNKAKVQVRAVAKNVKGNVKKATDAIGEAVGVKNADESKAEAVLNQSEEIVDGIIESVLEPSKKAVGLVVTNEELDALIPESLEAMSTAEIADLEAKKEEVERLEIEALEAQTKLEDERKAKSHIKKFKAALEADVVQNFDKTDNKMVSISSEEFIQLKENFLEEGKEDEEAPLESLGFISVVQSDVDSKMEEEIPDAAEMLHQMIDNKEFYTGEDSTKFESRASYENHGFEIEDCSFEAFEEDDKEGPTQAQLYDNLLVEDQEVPTVEVIYAQEEVIDFSEIVLENDASVMGQATSKDIESVTDMKKEESIVENENQWTGQILESDTVWNDMEDNAESFENNTVENVEDIQKHKYEYKADLTNDESEQEVAATLDIEENDIDVNSSSEEKVSLENERQLLRVRILITENMKKKLMDLKESR